eukprot:4339315-Amphidinium_carterae.2
MMRNNSPTSSSQDNRVNNVENLDQTEVVQHSADTYGYSINEITCGHMTITVNGMSTCPTDREIHLTTLNAIHNAMQSERGCKVLDTLYMRSATCVHTCTSRLHQYTTLLVQGLTSVLT